MIFTRNNQKGKSSKNVINLQLLAAKNKKGHQDFNVDVR